MEVQSNTTTTNSSTTEAPQQAFTPDQVIEQLRVIRTSIPIVAPLTSKERRAMHGVLKVSPEVLKAQLDVLGQSDSVHAAIGVSYAGAQQMTQDDALWSTVENEVLTLLNAISGGNLVRRQKLQLIGAQATTIGASLARSEEHAELKSSIERVRRLKRLARGKKSAPATPQTPAPETPGEPSGT